jgi:Pin2-interacting protein X1
MAEDTIASRSSFLHLAGSKLRARLSSQVNEASSEGVTSKFARRHLEKLGWEEGTGLGKRRSGITTHIKVQRRMDEQGGIGKSSVDDNLQIGNEWWKSSTGNILAKLGGKKKKKKGSKEKKSVFTDEELFEATGGARFGMRQGVRQEGKWNRTEKSAILKQQEEEAKQKVEWDGMTAPKVILSADSDNKKAKKKREREEEQVVETVEKETKEERRARKKRKKEEKKKKASS